VRETLIIFRPNRREVWRPLLPLCGLQPAPREGPPSDQQLERDFLLDEQGIFFSTIPEKLTLNFLFFSKFRRRRLQTFFSFRN
jgi:hypothetical protein